ncbi:MAG: Gfo/Idh/MocA family oxidoreductase [Phycisphaeraceae bacterium]
MKIAFIGVGGIAANYRNCLSTLQRPIAAVCDLDDELAERIGKEESCVAYSDYRKMLSDIRPDVVFVCIPPGLHANQVRDVVEVGSAVFVAKPVALNPGVAVLTRDAIASMKVVNQVGYVGRYSDVVSKAKQLVKDRPLALGSGRFMFRMVNGHPWWGYGKMSGGMMVEQSTHVFDTLRYFLGDIAEIHSFGSKHVSQSGIADFEECTVCNLRFASGAIGSVVSSCVAQATETSSIELVGDEIYLRISGETRLTGRVYGQNIDYTGAERGYFRQIKRFLEAVEKRDQSHVLCDYAEGVKTLATTLAANLSIRSGQAVRVQEN